MIVEAVNGFLCLGDYKRVTIHYDMNCIKIRLYGEADKERYLIYMYSPWRIVHNDALVSSSDLYPHEYRFESSEDHRRAFDKYCAKTRFLETQRIRRIEVKPPSNDLTIEWESGHRLEKVCMEEDADYHIYDRLDKMCHDFGFNSNSSESEDGPAEPMEVDGPATQPADRDPAEVQPPSPTPKDGPR